MIKLNIPAQSKNDNFNDANKIVFNTPAITTTTAAAIANNIQKPQLFIQSNGTFQLNEQILNNKDESVYKFDTLKKELSTSMNANNNTNNTNNNQIRFSLNPQENEDEENSNIMVISNSNGMGANLNQNQNQHMIIPSQIGNSTKTTSNNNNLNTEMEWNDSEIFQLCRELDEHDTFFNNNNNNNNNNKAASTNAINNNIQKSNKNELSFFSDINYNMAINNNNNNNNNQNYNFSFDLSDDIQSTSTTAPPPPPPPPLNHQDQNTFMFNNQNFLNDTSNRNDSIYRNLVFNGMQGSDMSINSTNNNNNNNTPIFLDNNSDASNVLIAPWEFDNDFSQSYLQSPTI